MVIKKLIFIERIKMKKNKKGFAISTMLYGIIFVAISVFYLIINIVSNRNTTNTNFVDEIRQDINAAGVN